MKTILCDEFSFSRPQIQVHFKSSLVARKILIFNRYIKISNYKGMCRERPEFVFVDSLNCFGENT